MDGPAAHPFNTFQRLNYLKAKQIEWKDLGDLEVINSIPLQGGCVQWILQASILVRAVNMQGTVPFCFDTVKILHLKSTAEELPERTLHLGSTFNGIEVDPRHGQDLLVLSDRNPYVQQ